MTKDPKIPKSPSFIHWPVQTNQSIATLLNDEMNKVTCVCIRWTGYYYQMQICKMQTCICVHVLRNLALSNGLSVKKSRLTDQTYVKDVRCTFYVNFDFRNFVWWRRELFKYIMSYTWCVVSVRTYASPIWNVRTMHDVCKRQRWWNRLWKNHTHESMQILCAYQFCMSFE